MTYNPSQHHRCGSLYGSKNTSVRADCRTKTDFRASRKCMFSVQENDSLSLLDLVSLESRLTAEYDVHDDLADGIQSSIYSVSSPTPEIRQVTSASVTQASYTHSHRHKIDQGASMGTLAAPASTKPTVLRVAAFSGSGRKDSWHAGLIRAGKLTHSSRVPDHSWWNRRLYGDRLFCCQM
jgi:hypothetical protein